MVRRIILGLIFAGVLALIYVGYKNWSFRRAMLSGDVTGGSNEAAGPESPGISPATARPESRQKPSPPSAQSATPLSKSAGGGSDGDTISPQPPNGTVFAGTGHFQVYRQGNLTWRIDTDTGKACVLFATTEEWRKPRVLQNGCGDSGKK